MRFMLFTMNRPKLPVALILNLTQAILSNIKSYAKYKLFQI